MKRTEKKLKTKGFRGYRFNHCIGNKYDRRFVAQKEEDCKNVSFSRTSFREWDCRRNWRLFVYLYRWLDKQVGKSVDVVFHDFKNLGWRSTHDMYCYWDWCVRVKDPSWDYHADENGCLVPTSWWKDTSTPKATDDGEDEKDNKSKPKRPKASDRRLTRKHLEYNDSVKVPDLEEQISCNPYPVLMGEFYIEHHHKVIKCPVYHIKYPRNPQYISFSVYASHIYERFWRDYIPVKIKGVYNEERKFIRHYWRMEVITNFNTKKQGLETEVVRNETDCVELLPYVRRQDVEE